MATCTDNQIVVTATDLVREALIRSGSADPSPEEMSRGKRVWLPEVMNDLTVRARIVGDGLFKTMHTTAWAITENCQRRYAMPCDYDDEMHITLLTGSVTGTATAGDTTEVTLAAGAVDPCGSYVVMTAGTSKGQARQVVSWDSDTVTATVEDDWDEGKTPISGDTYMVVTDWIELEERWPTEFDERANQSTTSRPIEFMVFQNEIYLDPTPNDAYAIRLRYYANPAKIDLDDAKWTIIYRDWQRVLTLGLQLIAEQNNDDTRAENTKRMYDEALLGTVRRENPFGDELVEFTMERCR